MKIVSASNAVESIPDDATIAIGGTGAVLEPNAVLEALEHRFLMQGSPKNLTVVSPMCPGDRAGEGGLNCIAHDGMLHKIIGSSFNTTRHPRLIEMLRGELCEGYTVGMGAMVQLMSAIGAGKPGVFSRAGLNTFLDPAFEGGRMNQRSVGSVGKRTEVDGRDYIFYPSFPVDVAIIRATTADEGGFLSMEEEPNSLGMLEIALAAKSSGGRVIAQVKRVAQRHSLDPRSVRVPGPLVDMVVVEPKQTQVSPAMSDPLSGWNPFLAGALRSPLHDLSPISDGPASMLLKRAALELRRNDVVNVGAGVATHLPRVVEQEGLSSEVCFTNEHGVFGGLMATAIGGSFVPALNADAVMDSAFQFQYYNGGGLDIAFLGMGEVDATGNVNVSKFGTSWNGPGGFADIVDGTDRIVICGTFTSGGLRERVEGGRLHIDGEGRLRKFVDKVEQVTLNGIDAYRRGKRVLYVTEPAVFELTNDGLRLTEVAEGVDIKRDVIAEMGFIPEVARNVHTFSAGVMGSGPYMLRESLMKGE